MSFKDTIRGPVAFSTVRDSRSGYARTRDGARIAYEVIGEGQPVILELGSGGPTLSIDSTDEQPEWRRYVDRLAGIGRLIRFDPRGVGLSDPFELADPPTVDERSDDALAVLDATSTERAVLLASTSGGYPAMFLAASRPDRVEGLVLIHAMARVVATEGYPWGMSAPDWEALRDGLFDPDANPEVDYFALTAPSKATDVPFRDWWDRAGRRGASPAVAQAIFAATANVDVREILCSIRVPTLVLHRRDNRFIEAEHSAFIATQIPDARIVELPGGDHVPWLGDQTSLLEEVEEFVTGQRAAVARLDRVLATVLFTDIVDSTGLASRTGDAAWRHVLDRHDAAVEREVTRYAGRVVKFTGDGSLCLFDGPGSAIRAALAMRAKLSVSGIDVRIGMHTGEVELRGDDVGGIAVHIAARVSSLASAGEVLASRTVSDLVAGSGISFIDLGQHTLRGVPGKWSVVAVGSIPAEPGP